MNSSEQPYPTQAVMQLHLKPSTGNNAGRLSERWARLRRFDLACTACAWGMAFIEKKFLLSHLFCGEQMDFPRIIPWILPA